MVIEKGQLKIVVRPEKEPKSALDHELCVIFPCGREVVVNRNTEYTLMLFRHNDNVIDWACELLANRKGCAILKLAL